MLPDPNAPQPPILVLGLGNVLLLDEGAGPRVIEELQARYRFPDEVEVADGGTMGMELLPVLCGRRHVLIIDAARTGVPPGSIMRVPLADAAAFFRQRLSPHQIGLADVLGATALLGDQPDEIIFFGIEPEKIGTGLELSPEVKTRLPELARLVVEELARLGVTVGQRKGGG